MENPVGKGYLVAHTHWDREWRYPLWENRKYLVDLMDALIEHLENTPTFTSFLLDGQLSPLLDYIEVRPHQRHRLLELVRQGRIEVGPWFTLPDLYPVSGESLVRNLHYGNLLCKQLEIPVLDIAYESFGWGQPSQLPQLYKEFGIDTVIVSKNVNKSRAPHCEFVWRGKDGTEVLATRLGADARANFFMNTYMEVTNSADYKTDEYRYRWNEMGQNFHQADASGGYIEDYFRIEDTQSLDRTRVRAAFLKSWHNMDDSLLPNDRILMSGSDSTSCQTHLGEVMDAIHQEFEDIKLTHVTLTEYVKKMKEKLDKTALLTLEGELRDGPAQSLSANALMTRPHIKQLSRHVEVLLYGRAEPFSLVAEMLGGRYEQEFLSIAHKYLLLSHPHDSLNGVTQDKTVQDVLYRLEQTSEISTVVYNTACQHILQNIDTSRTQDDDVLLAVFNPLPWSRREVLHLFVDTPQEQNVWDFGIEDMQGQIHETCHIGRTTKTIPVCDNHTRPWPFYADRHEILLDTGALPAGGYKLYRLTNKTNFTRTTEFWAQTRKTKGNELASSPTTMENEYLSVEVQPNGSVSLLEKESGHCYENLNYYESTGDVGDYWIYYPPYNNQTYTSKGSSAKIWLEENTTLQATIAVQILMELPAHGYRPEKYHIGESRRSNNHVQVPITTRYTLRKGEKLLRVESRIHNTAKDHRMQVVFETGVKTNTAIAEGHFCVDKRSCLPLADKDGYHFNELIPQPMQDFVALENENKGLAVLNEGMCEYESLADPKGTLSLTLFRAVRNIICTEQRSAGEFPNQSGGQLQQELCFQYALYPYTGDWESADVLPTAKRLRQPATTVQTSKAKHNVGALPYSASLYSIPEGLVLSALKKSEETGNVILRVYNPESKAISGKIKLHSPMKQCWLTDLKEDRLQELACSVDSVDVNMSPDKIVTLEIKTF